MGSFGCFTADRHGLQNLASVGEDNICFETDYPHTDTTWPYSKEYAEKMVTGLSDDVAYKVLRGNAYSCQDARSIASDTVARIHHSAVCTTVSRRPPSSGATGWDSTS